MAGAGASKLCVVARKARNHQVALLMQKSCCLITKILLEEAKIKELTEELQGRTDVTASPRLGTHASSQILLEYLSFLNPLCQFNHSPNPCSWVFPIKHFHSEDPRTSSTKNNLNLNLKLNTFHLTFSLNYSLLINSGSPTFLIHKLYAHCEDRFSPAFDRCAVCRTGQKVSVIPPVRALSGRTLYPKSVCWAYPFSSCTIVKFILKRFFCILKFYHFFFRDGSKVAGWDGHACYFCVKNYLLAAGCDAGDMEHLSHSSELTEVLVLEWLVPTSTQTQFSPQRE